MKCPVCERNLQEKRIETTGGTVIDIFCSNCGYTDHHVIGDNYKY